ncbi:unnamed protein product, partial [marine sediment metagenome]
MALIPSLVAAQTVMRLEKERRKKLKAKPAGITFGRRNPMPLNSGEITEIATRTADEVMERIRDQEHDSLLLNSVPYAYGSPGIVVDEALARATSCRCLEYRPGKKLCFSKGIIG